MCADECLCLVHLSAGHTTATKQKKMMMARTPPGSRSQKVRRSREGTDERTNERSKAKRHALLLGKRALRVHQGVGNEEG
uniref:Uncharacterized protein n=1 Tax=Caenorhabditis japonica TaxID=281687 RepID=A0A8R1EG23_CAEJA